MFNPDRVLTPEQKRFTEKMLRNVHKLTKSQMDVIWTMAYGFVCVNQYEESGNENPAA